MATFACTGIDTTTLGGGSDVDPQAWLADVLVRIAEHPVQKLADLLPWNRKQISERTLQAA